MGPKKLLIATQNQGKIAEYRELFKDIPVDLSFIENIPEPEETGLTFQENALLKAEYYKAHVGYSALADDAGLVIPALDGQPGIYTSRWAQNGTDFPYGMSRIEEELKKKGLGSGVEAYFYAVLCLCWEDGRITYVDGRLDGTLTFPARGTNGFGYDPIFIPKGYDKTNAELPPDVKLSLSYRTHALKKLIQQCF